MMRIPFKLMLTIGAACSVLAFSSGAYADQDRWEGRRAQMEQTMQKVFDQLNLSEVQRKALDENKAKHKDAKEVLGKQLRSAMQSMGDELKKKDYDLDKLNQIQGQIKQLRDQMADERFNAILTVRKILTPEQFAKFTDLLDEHKGKMFK